MTADGRGPAAAAALVCAAAAAGCGFGPGPSSEGTATLTVTRDYGSKTLVDEAETDPHSSETVIRFLDREAEHHDALRRRLRPVDRRPCRRRAAGGATTGSSTSTGSSPPVGSAEVHVHGGDRIWWDYRDWTDAMQVPAVVGSWPEPFTQASAEGDRRAGAVECLAGGSACDTAAHRLADAGVDASVERGAGSARRNGALGSWSGPWAPGAR